MFGYRWLIDSDYEDTLVNWWKDWRFPPPPKDFLPDNGRYGLMVYKGDVNICAGFIYPVALSKVCFMEYIVSNFNYKEKDRDEAISYLVDSLTDLATDQGYDYVYTSVKNQSLMNRLEIHGFIKGDVNCVAMIGNLR